MDDDDLNVLFVEYCAKDFIDGVQQLDPFTELAYRRICDLIYVTNGKLIDDDKVLFYSTKMGPKWKGIKHDLIHIHKKIYVENGYIQNATCTEKLEKSRKNIRQKAEAGNASAEKRKSLKNNKTGSTGVPTADPTAVPTGVPTNQRPNNQIELLEIVDNNNLSQKSKNGALAINTDFEDFWKGWTPFDMPKGSKADAKKNYIKARKETNHETLVRKRSEYLEHAHRTKSKTKHAATWLSKRGWEDDFPDVDTGTHVLPHGAKANPDHRLRNRVHATTRIIDDLIGD